jgi:hypothetical protein
VDADLKMLDLWSCIGYAAPMTVESPISPGYKPNEKELLETFLLMTLEEHDGLCLDNEEERQQLAAILAGTLITASHQEPEPEVSPVVAKQEHKQSLWPEPTTERPDIETLEGWHSDSGCEATDGCWVEPDGVCEHGHPSWLLRFGYI